MENNKIAYEKPIPTLFVTEGNVVATSNTPQQDENETPQVPLG